MNVKNAILGSLCVVVFLGVCAFIFYMAFYQSSDYYTIVDNSNVESISDDDFKFRYTLDSFNSDGKEKSIAFETTRELRSGAYLKIKYMITRGVVSWEEVKFDELPRKVKSKFEE